MYLIDHLVEEGAHVIISDIYEDRIKTITSKHSQVGVVDADAVYDAEMDIYAPCALGATVNSDTLARLKCSIIAGAANNQLANEAEHGKAVMEQGMLYAPDFLINAGGLINCDSELEGYNRDRAFQKAENIYNTTLDILKLSEEKNITSNAAATMLAEQRIAAIGKVSLGQ